MKKIVFKFFAITIIGLSSVTAQVGIGTTNPHASAELDMESTTKGFLFPRITTVQRDFIASPAAGLMIYNTDENCIEFWNSTEWISMCSDQPFVPGPVSDCATTTVPFLSADDPVFLSAFGEVTSVSGTWMDRNLGAHIEARSSDDCFAFGNLYQWGRATEGHEDRNSATYTGSFPADATVSGAWDGRFILNDFDSKWHNGTQAHNETLWQGVSGVNNPCPSGYRLPTSTEMSTELSNFPSLDAQGAYDSNLKLPKAGLRINGLSTGNGDVDDTEGGYWISTLLGNSPRALTIERGALNATGIFNLQYNNGYSVRCIRD